MKQIKNIILKYIVLFFLISVSETGSGQNLLFRIGLETFREQADHVITVIVSIVTLKESENPTVSAIL